MVTVKHQRYLLMALGGLWMVLLLLRLTGESGQQEAPLKLISRLRGAASQKVPAGARLHVKSLDPAAQESVSTPTRNIFVDGSGTLLSEDRPHRSRGQKKDGLPPALEVVTVAPPPPPTPQPEAVASPPGPSAEELAEQARRQQHELKLKQLREQMGQYRYLGYLAQDGERKAFLGKGHEIYIIRQGDKLDGKFHVAVVEAASVKLRETESALEATIQLKKEGPGESS